MGWFVQRPLVQPVESWAINLGNYNFELSNILYRFIRQIEGIRCYRYGGEI